MHVNHVHVTTTLRAVIMTSRWIRSLVNIQGKMFKQRIKGRFVVPSSQTDFETDLFFGSVGVFFFGRVLMFPSPIICLRSH